MPSAEAPAFAGMTGVCGNDVNVRVVDGRRGIPRSVVGSLGSARSRPLTLCEGGVLFPQPRRYLHERFLHRIAEIVQLLRRD